MIQAVENALGQSFGEPQLSRFACEWHCRILLKSQADGILANDRANSAAIDRPTTAASITGIFRLI
jgi:hypothetical protein